jgi:hypothetical protein
MDRLDQAAKDGAFRLTQYLQLYPIPDTVKAASYADVSKTDLPDTEFAYVGTPRQFPCNSPASTLVSYLFYLEKSAQISQEDRNLIERRFSNFGSVWNVKQAMQDVAKKFVERQTKDAGLRDSDFALVTVVNGEKKRHYPLRNPAEVKAAADWFVRADKTLRDVYDFPIRVGLARSILNKAAEFKVTLTDSQQTHLTKCAATGIQMPSKIAEQIEYRVKLASKAPDAVKEAMLVTRDFIKQHPYRAVEDELAIKIADTLEKFDRVYLHDEPYTGRLASPEDALFGLSIKQAEALVNNCCALVSGNAYDKNDFKLLTIAAVKEAFGPEFANDVQAGVFVNPVKMAELAVTLPLPDAKQLDRLMELAGAKPIEKTAADFNDQLRKDLTAITQAIMS